MTKLRFRSVAALLLVLHLAGCVTWKPYVLEPEETLPKAVRLHLQSGDQLELHSPSLRGDSLLSGQLGRKGQALQVPLSSVRSMEAPHTDVAKSILAVAGSLAGGYVVLVLIALTACSLEDCS